MSDQSVGSLHPFDQALQLTPTGVDEYAGATHERYWNMIGPYGGITAAAMLQAVMQHPDRLGEPVALTVNFAGPVARGPFILRARAARTNRSSQHWVIEQLQADAQGRLESVTTASAVTALRRGGFALVENTMPEAPAPETVAQVRLRRGPEWFGSYELRPVKGGPPRVWDGSDSGDSLNQLWMRDAPNRPLDYLSLTACADFFYPRIWGRRATLGPVSTVSMTVYFHTDAKLLADTGEGYLLGQSRGQVFFKGFFDMQAQLWNQQGALLATTHQTLYFKE